MLKTLLLLSIAIGMHQTVKAHLHQGTYTISDSCTDISKIANIKVNTSSSQVLIQGACQTQTASYMVRKGYIPFGQWISTTIQCNDNIEPEIANLFGKAVKISAYAGKAYLYDFNGGKILKLKKVCESSSKL